MEKTAEQIRQDVIKQLKWDSRIKSENIFVEVTGHTVVLTGTVSSNLQRISAENDCRSVQGVSVVDNRLQVMKPATEQIPDEKIKWNIESALSLNSTINASMIEVAVNNGKVTLAGSVDQFWKKLKIEEIVSNVPGVYEIVNTLTVVPTNSPFDQAISTDILSAISRLGRIDPESIHVEVNGGRVRLRGKVPDWQSYSAAYNISKHTNGVTDLINELVISE